MSTILINASNLKQGGGIQVAQSVCGEIHKFRQHRFIVVASLALDLSHVQHAENVVVITYSMPLKVTTLLFGRDKFLDGIVAKENVDVVLTVFGPSIWSPRVPHLCGFARAQLLLKVDGFRTSMKEKMLYAMWKWSFRKSSDTFYTENAFITEMLPNLIKGAKVYTVTNYYNQVYDQPERWKRSVTLPLFNGATCLSVSSHYLHKNFEIMIESTRHLKVLHPDFKFRFVLTFDAAEMPVPDDVREHFIFIGKVDVSECPYLYEQADIMFMPTLMECFTATYPEAMRMGKPIVTTDLEFARGLCGDAACYYSAMDAMAAAEAIYKVAIQKEYAAQLVANGKKQLLEYDNYEQRAEKLVKILEELVAKE